MRILNVREYYKQLIRAPQERLKVHEIVCKLEFLLTIPFLYDYQLYIFLFVRSYFHA